MSKQNIFAEIPAELPDELFDILAEHNSIKIERIISKGHTSPASGWYDQAQGEWVIVLRGEAILTFESGEDVHLFAGDYINISAHVRHKVTWTKPDAETVWLAVFY